MNKKSLDFLLKLQTKNTNLILDDIYINAKTKIHIKDTRCNHRWEIIPTNLLTRGTGITCPVCNGKNCGKNKLWTETELEILKNNYSHLSNTEIAALIPRSTAAIFIKAKELNLKKPKDFNKYTLEEINTIVKTKFPSIEVLRYNKYSDNNSVIRYLDCGHTKDNTCINSLLNTISSGNICRICTPATNSFKTIEEINDRLSIYTDSVICTQYEGKLLNSTLKCSVCEYTWTTNIHNCLTHNYGHTCKNCNPTVAGTSKKEKEILSFIKSNYSGWIIENDTLNIYPQELDIVIPDLGIAIEYNGVYWHSDNFKDKHYHINKTNKLKEAVGYQLIHINSDEWEHKSDIVKSRLLSILGKTKRIYARNCMIKQISFPKEFLNANHIQGSGSPSSINLGLYYNNELVSVMTFSRPRFNFNYEYELIRFCNKLNITVIGGASKLFKYFLRTTNTNSIISYSDKRWSTGNVYRLLGFEYLHTSEPNYRYYKNEQSLSRYKCQKHKLKELFPEIYSDDLTESEIMKLAGYVRMYDCGNDTWVYSLGLEGAPPILG